MQRGMHDGLHLVRGNTRFPSAARAHLAHRVQSVGTKPRAPIQHRRSADAEDGRDVTIRHAVTSHEQDLGAGNDAIGRAFTARPLRQDVAIRVAQRQRCSRIVHTRRYTIRHHKCQSILETSTSGMSQK